MRAIEAGELAARRDNRNQWRIEEDDLAQWARSEREQVAAQEEKAAPEQNSSHEVALLKALLEAEKLRSEAAERALLQAEKDRDRWHELAIKPWWKRLIG